MRVTFEILLQIITSYTYLSNFKMSWVVTLTTRLISGKRSENLQFIGSITKSGLKLVGTFYRIWHSKIVNVY